MGRRALRKIRPDLDLSQHLLSLEPDAPPLPPDFGFSHPAAPLEVEVGSGKGLFLATAAAACPGHNFLGIELIHKYARFAAARLVKHRLDNARMVHGDAERFFHEQLRDDSVAAVHVYFPDPWWKKRHHKRRIMNERFLAQVVRVLQPAGQLHFWTDVEEYFRLATDLIARATPLEGPLPVPERTPAHDLDYRTHFERRKRLEGLPIFRAEYLKPAATRQP